ncbi:MAG TPA: ABC transporter ATP-binding protein [Ilumatobacteraceae bacterium]|nr:ABC transporter ATP-binding protein [Ilumatobacteraceae bacterium]
MRPLIDPDETGELPIWRIAWRAAHHEPRSFWLGWVAFVVFFSMPALTGYLLASGFEALSDGDTAAVYRYAAAVAVAETLRMASVHFGAITWTKAWAHMQTLLRANLLTAQVASGGPEAGQPVGSAGEALTHFRDDTEDIAMLVDGLVDVSGGLVFTVAAGFLLGSANALAATVLLIPLAGVVLTTKALDGRIKRYRADDRAATAAVTGLVGDIMAAATTVKVNNATDAMLGRLRGLVDERRRTAVRDQVLDEGVMAFSQGAADVGLGLVLLVSAGALANGTFDVGTLALFVAYLGWLSFLPRMVGRMLARRKQASIAVDRMRQLVAGRSPERLAQTRVLPIERRQRGERPPPDRPDRVPLEVLDVVGLAARYPGGAGVHDITFSLRRGDFVVLTGPVGAGKSTLLRALLGLSWQAEVVGEVRWNGTPLRDRAAFLVPPNAAFLPQVPQLVSDSVRDNVGLGPVDDTAFAHALSLAAIDDDVAEMPDGERTLIGPRGLRLSGGQRQRLATARALVHAPELVVLDDLSSAVDVETELQLWDNLAAAGLTVLAVSHRAVAFERADQVLRLDHGALIGF